MVYLRKPCGLDIPVLEQAYSKSDFHHPFAFPPTDYEQYVHQIHRYLLCHQQSHEILGTFHISNPVRGYFQSAYLGYEAFAPHQGKGFMKQGLRLLLNEAFQRLNLYRLEANIQTENLASIRVVEACGFVKEGFSKHYLNIGGKGWKDHWRYAIVSHAWQPQGDQVRLVGHIQVPVHKQALIQAALPIHIENTRAESGCITFELEQHPIDPCRFEVFEIFQNQNVFDQHQARVQTSEWGALTTDAQRFYEKF